MKYIKWGIIGCGNVVERRSGKAFDKIEGSSIETIMSRNFSKVEAYAKEHNIKNYCTDAYEVINNPNVNAIYIATPPAIHATYAIMAMKVGKPVYVEKPLASSYDECVRINRTSEETGIPCFVAYYKRYLPYFKKVECIIKSGILGKINTININLSRPVEGISNDANGELPWRFKPEISGGGLFYDLASHQLDLLQHFFGVIVQAYGISTNNSGLYAAEDTVSACLKFEHGLIGTGNWCFNNHKSAKDDCITIIGDKGFVKFATYEDTPIQLTTENGSEYFDIKHPETPAFELIKNIVEHLQGFSICNCTSISTTPVNWVMDRILRKI